MSYSEGVANAHVRTLGESVTVRRLIIILTAGLLCGCVLVAGCNSSDAAVTTSTTGTAVTTGTAITTGMVVTTGTAQLYPVVVDGKWGFIDNTGAIKIEPQFAGIRRLDGEGGLIGFCEGLVAVRLVENGPWGYIDTSGRMVIEPQFDLAQWFSEGLAVVRNAAGWYFIDKTGAWAVEPRFDDAHSFSEGLAIVWENDQCGYIDKTGTVVIPIQCQIAGFDFSGGVARVGGGFDGSPSYIDKIGKVIWQGE